MLIRGKSKLKEYWALSAVFSSGCRVAVYSEPSTRCSSSTAQRQDVEFLTIHPSLYTTALQIFARIKKNARITVPLFIAILCLIMRSCYSRRSFGAEPWWKTETIFHRPRSLVSEIWSYPHLLARLPYCNYAPRWAHSSIIHRMQDFYSISSRRLEETL